MRWQAAVVLLFLASPAAYAGEQIQLVCNGIELVKHYDKDEQKSFLVEINFDNKTVILLSSEEVITTGNDYKITGKKSEFRISNYKIIDYDENLILIENRTDFELSDMIFKTHWLWGTSEVKIPDDEFAEGKIDRITGKISIQTKNYESRESKYEYGWKLELNCAGSDRKF